MDNENLSKSNSNSDFLREVTVKIELEKINI